MKIIVVGATGYIGKKIFSEARLLGSAIGTSSKESSMLYLDLMHPEYFNYKDIKPDDFIIMTAAISSPDSCAKTSMWSINVEGTTKFIRRSK